MKKMQLAFGWLMAGMLALGAFSTPAHAATDGELTFGSLWWNRTAPEAKFHEYEDLSQGGFLRSFLLREDHGRNFVDLYGQNAFRTDQGINFRWWNGVRYNLDLSDTRVPHSLSDITRTPFTQISPGVFVLPDSVQAMVRKLLTRGTLANNAPSTAALRDLLANSHDLPMDVQTDVVSGRLRVRPVTGLRLEGAASVRDRYGDKPYGGTFGFSNDVELTEPVDQRIVDGDLRADYQSGNVALQLNGGISDFHNRIPVRIWDNPWINQDTVAVNAAGAVTSYPSARGRMPLYPDNRVYRGNAMVNVSLPHRTALTGTFGYSRNTQNQPWVPHTINSVLQRQLDALGIGVLPDSSTHGKANITTLDLRAASRLTDKLWGRLRFNSSKYDNQTPVYTFDVRVPYDYSITRPLAIPGGVEDDFHNEPFGNDRRTAGLDLSYDVMSRVTLEGSYELRARNHTEREVTDDTENWASLAARAHPRNDVSLLARYQHGKRLGNFNPDEYVEELAVDTLASEFIVGLEEQRGLQRFDVADRAQDQVDLQGSWMATEKLDFAASYRGVRNDYFHNQYGLQRDSREYLSVESGIHPNASLDLNAGVGFGWSVAIQRSHTSNHAAPIDTLPGADWRLKFADQTTYLNLGLDWHVKPDKFDVTASYNMDWDNDAFHFWNPAQSDTSIHISGVTPAVDVPNVTSRRHQLGVGANYVVWANTHLGLNYQFDEYNVRDWGRQSAPLVNPPTGTASAIFLGAAPQHFDAHRVSLWVRRDF